MLIFNENMQAPIEDEEDEPSEANASPKSSISFGSRSEMSLEAFENELVDLTHQLHVEETFGDVRAEPPLPSVGVNQLVVAEPVPPAAPPRTRTPRPSRGENQIISKP